MNEMVVKIARDKSVELFDVCVASTQKVDLDDFTSLL